MDSQELRRMKELEEENRRLKQMYADLALDHKILKDVYNRVPIQIKAGVSLALPFLM